MDASRRERFVQWLTHDFFKASAILFGLNVVGTVLNMVCRMVLGRLLTPEQYGEMETAMQLIGYIGIPLATLQIVLMREVAFADGQGDPEKIRAITWFIGRMVVGYSFLGMMLLLAASSVLRDWFHLNSVWPIVAVSTMGVSGCIQLTLSSTLLGVRRFWQGGVVSLVGPISKILLAWILISAGFGATGGVAAQSGANLAMSLVGLAYSWRFVFPRPSLSWVPESSVFRYYVPVAVTLLLASFVGGVDMFFVKRIFPALDAGHYAQVSTVVKLSWFFSGAMTITMFPWVASEQAGGRKTGHLLVKVLAVGVGFALVAALLFTVIPGFFLRIFYRDINANMIYWTRLMAWTLIPGSLLNTMIQYHMARHEYGFLKWMGPACVLYAALLILFRHSIPALIGAVGAGSFVIVAILAWQAYSGPRPTGPLQDERQQDG